MYTYAPPAALTEWAGKAPPTLQTIPAMFRASAARFGTRPFLGRKLPGGAWVYQSYQEVAEQVNGFAAALVAAGLQPGDCLAQMSANRPEWVLTDLGAMHAGLVHTPLYPTLSAEAAQYILRDCKARVAVAGTAEQLARIVSVEGNLPDLEILICDEPCTASTTRKLYTFAEFMALEGAAGQGDEVERRVGALQATDVCSLVYTSGTTGEPKGAMLMHGNFLSNAATAGTLIGLDENDLELSFLPLSHVFERVVYYAFVHAGGAIAYAESIDTVSANLQEVRPTLMASVPRLYEKVVARVREGVEKGPGLKKKLFGWATGVGGRYFEARKKGAVPNLLSFERRFAYKLVLSKIHERFGGRIRYLLSGGAPLRKDVGDFFTAAGFKIMEGYGLTETSPIIAFNPPEHIKIGTVGRPLAEVEVRIADDGEILARGPNIMQGYLNKPEQTREVIDPDGWFHTGDIGRFDEDGYLMITDRKKELLVLSNGKKVAPAQVEELLKSSPYIEQAVALGDNRNFVGALVVPAFSALEGWAAHEGLSGSPQELAAHPRVEEFLTRECERVCESLSNYERVKKIAVLPGELTQDAGELTPTLKVKRRVVLERYKAEVERIYS